MTIASIQICQSELPVRNSPSTMASAQVWSLTSAAPRFEV